MRPHSFELRPPQSSHDWDRYHDIRRRCLFEKYHGKGTQYHCEYDADYPDEWSPGHQPLVFLCGHEVTGTIRIDFKPAGRAVFRLIAIDTPRQGQGLGNIMLEMAEDYARARGVDFDLPEFGARCLWLLCPPRVQTMALGRLYQQSN